MKIAILGYGKMGKTIDKLATSRGHEIILKATSQNPATEEELKKSDVAIEFTTPESAPANLKMCLEAGIPVVTGSTGWGEYFQELKKSCEEKSGKLFYASNFSVGVNLFFKVNQYLAKLMDNHPEYSPDVKEWHHIHKKDAPSGTAVTLLEQLLSELKQKNSWSMEKDVADDQIPVEAIREGEIFGTHQIRYKSDIDQISIEHKAFGREGFAKGAILAAEWILDKSPGMYTMTDLLE